MTDLDSATFLDGVIDYWKSKQFHDKHLMSPSVQYLVDQTIKYLEELKKLKGDNPVSAIPRS